MILAWLLYIFFPCTKNVGSILWYLQCHSLKGSIYGLTKYWTIIVTSIRYTFVTCCVYNQSHQLLCTFRRQWWSSSYTKNFNNKKHSSCTGAFPLPKFLSTPNATPHQQSLASKEKWQILLCEICFIVTVNL